MKNEISLILMWNFDETRLWIPYETLLDFHLISMHTQNFAFAPRYGVCWYPWDLLQLHHEVRRRHQEGPVRQQCTVRWHHHVPRYRWQDAEGNHCPCSSNHEDQDHRPTREKVLRMDRWLHLGLPLHLPADVDLQAGVRRVRTIHRSQEMLLNSLRFYFPSGDHFCLAFIYSIEMMMIALLAFATRCSKRTGAMWYKLSRKLRTFKK